MSAFGLAGHMTGRCDNAGRGRRSAAPFGILMSLALHLAAALAVVTAWKTGGVLNPAEIALVDVVRPATPVSMPASEPAPSPKPAASRPAAGKPRAMPAPEPAARPLIDASPVPENVPARPAALDVTPGVEAPRRVDRVQDASGPGMPHEPPHAAGPAGRSAPARGGQAPPDAAGTDIEPVMRAYADTLRQIIESRLEYPVVARRARLEGACTVACRLMCTGEVADIRIASSTGHSLLDRAALKAVLDAGRFPPPPASVCCMDELTVEVPVTFRLTGR